MTSNRESDLADIATVRRIADEGAPHVWTVDEQRAIMRVCELAIALPPKAPPMPTDAEGIELFKRLAASVVNVTFAYNAHSGTAQYIATVGYFGELDDIAPDVATFEGKTFFDAAQAFRDTVDDYIALKGKT